MEKIYVGQYTDHEKGIYSLEDAQALIEGNGGYSAKILSCQAAFKVANNPEKYSAALLFAASDKLDSLMKFYLNHDDGDNYFTAKKLQDNIIDILK